jgi:hypothetical protein
MVKIVSTISLTLYFYINIEQLSLTLWAFLSHRRYCGDDFLAGILLWTAPSIGTDISGNGLTALTKGVSVAEEETEKAPSDDVPPAA